MVHTFDNEDEIYLLRSKGYEIIKYEEVFKTYKIKNIEHIKKLCFKYKVYIDEIREIMLFREDMSKITKDKFIEKIRFITLDL